MVHFRVSRISVVVRKKTGVERDQTDSKPRRDVRCFRNIFPILVPRFIRRDAAVARIVSIVV
jgi:hypothetical protein